MRSVLTTATGAAVLALCLVSSATAERISDRVRASCAGDYMGHCSGATTAHDAYRCMRNVGPRLSKSCLVALIRDGYVTRAEVLRRANAPASTSDICRRDDGAMKLHDTNSTLHTRAGVC